MGLKTQTGKPYMLLLKLGQREHMEMLRNGLLYMNSLAFFKSLESDPAREDPYEGTDSIVQPSDIGEFIFDPHIPGLDPFHVHGAPPGLVGPVRLARHRTSSCNIFCMFVVTRPIDGPIFPKPYQWFGDSFVLFTNTQEFLDRVVRAAQNQGLKVEGRAVEYYDRTKYSGPTWRFRKPSIYSYQSEYRFVVEPGVDGPFRFEIGDLSDITSEVIPLDSADEALKFSPDDAIEAGLSWD
jgi:hypothetical protein